MCFVFIIKLFPLDSSLYGTRHFCSQPLHCSNHTFIFYLPRDSPGIFDQTRVKWFNNVILRSHFSPGYWDMIRVLIMGLGKVSVYISVHFQSSMNQSQQLQPRNSSQTEFRFTRNISVKPTPNGSLSDENIFLD